jgi:glycosyltransferase involved in cell wall biosynthesis
MKKKLYIENCDFNIGGVQRVHVDLANHFAQKDEFEVYLATPKVGDESNYEIDQNVNRLYPPHDSHPFKRMFFLFKFLLKNKVDVYLGLYTKQRVLPILFKVPKVYHIIHSCYDSTRNEILSESVLRFFTQYVSVSEAARLHANKVLNISLDRIKTIPNGIDCSNFRFKNRSLPKKCLTICNVGRADLAAKGQDTLLKIAEELIDLKGQIKFVLVGGGDDLNSIKEMAEEVDSTGSYIDVMGEQKDISAILEQADIFLSTLRYAGFDLVLAEAMATGLPVIASNVGPIPAVIGGEKERCGILVEPENISEFSKAVRQLVFSSDERLERGKNCRDYVVENYSIESTFSSYEEVF